MERDVGEVLWVKTCGDVHRHPEFVAANLDETVEQYMALWCRGTFICLPKVTEATVEPVGYCAFANCHGSAERFDALAAGFYGREPRVGMLK